MFYAENSHGTTCCDYQARVNCVNQSGSLLFSLPFNYLGVNYITGITKTLDNKILVTAYTNLSCDVGGSHEYFAVLDTNGNVVKQQTFSTVPTSFVPVITECCQYTDSSFYFVGGDKVYHYSKNGNYVSTKQAPSFITAMEVLSNGHFLAGTASSNPSYQLLEMDTACNVIQQQLITTRIKELFTHPLYPSKHYAIMADSSLQVFSGNLSSTATYTGNYTGMTHRNDSLFFVGTTGSANKPFYQITNLNLTTLYSTTGQSKYTTPTGIALAGNKASIITTGICSDYHVIGFSTLYQLPLTGGYLSKADVGVTNYTVMSNNTFVYLPAGTPVFNLMVMVKNFGNTTVNSFYLNSYGYSFGCDFFYHKKISASINPGDSLAVQTGTFYGEPFNLVNTNPGASYNANLCVCTSVPDSINDADADNDRLCKSVYLVRLGVNETSIDETNLDVFLNPFSSQVFVTTNIAIKHCVISDATGRIVFENETLKTAINYLQKTGQQASTLYVTKPAKATCVRS